MATSASDNRDGYSSRIGFDSGYLQDFEDKMFIEGADSRRRYTDFGVLLLLATVIGTYGLLANSTATVIGAMIVAPLMQPIMATAAAVVMGSARRTARALSMVGVGVVSVVGVAMLLTTAVPDVTISFEDNGELASRISPNLLALLTALGSGAAGAYIALRKELADAMGGVAIAISLVPPLAVVGIALNQHEWNAAWGASTLFLTNFLAILLAGGLTFLLSGLGRVALSQSDQRLRRNAFLLVILATATISIPLTTSTLRTVDEALETEVAAGETRLWLRGTDLELLSVSIRQDDVNVVVGGLDAAPAITDLSDSLALALKRHVVVHLRLVPSATGSSGSPE